MRHIASAPGSIHASGPALSRRFGILITIACLFGSMLLLLRRKRIPRIAVGPVWRLMGVIFATLFLLTFAPTKWIHHRLTDSIHAIYGLQR